MVSPRLEDDGDDHEQEEGDDSKTSRELAALRAAVERLTGMVNELVQRPRDEGAG